MDLPELPPDTAISIHADNDKVRLRWKVSRVRVNRLDLHFCVATGLLGVSVYFFDEGTASILLCAVVLSGAYALLVALEALRPASGESLVLADNSLTAAAAPHRIFRRLTWRELSYAIWRTFDYLAGRTEREYREDLKERRSARCTITRSDVRSVRIRRAFLSPRVVIDAVGNKLCVGKGLRKRDLEWIFAVLHKWVESE